MRVKLRAKDGLGPYEIKRIRSALRDVWRYSLARRLTEKRCTGKDGFARCEKCKQKTPKLKIDHIIPCGKVDSGYIKRLFCPSGGLQGLCHKCHKIKTKQERIKDKVVYTKDFY